MEFSAEIIATFLDGEIVGDKSCVVSNVAKIEEGAPGSISFLSNPKYEKYIYSTKSTIVIVSSDFVAAEPISATLIKVADPYGAFAQLLELYVAAKADRKGVSSQSFVDEGTQLPDDIYVGAFVSIGKNVKIGKEVKIYANVSIDNNVTIGDNTTIYAGVSIYDETVIGNNVIIHSGTVLGADGFGFAPEGLTFKKIPQIGNVVIEDDVELGANCTIDRATMGSTVIRKGVKLDNLVQVAHNVEIGANTVSAAQTGVSGSTKIGENCIIGGQVGISGHITIADRVKISSQSGISNNIKEEDAVLMGTPAYNASACRRSIIIQKSLPQLSTQVSKLEKELAALKALIQK